MNETPKVVFSRKGLGEPGHTELTRGFRDATRVKVAEGWKPAPVPSASAATWAEAVVAGANLAEEIARLKRQPGKEILAHGGAGFARSLVQLGLVDEYRLLVHPVALWRGLSLFSGLSEPVSSRLSSVTAFSAGAGAHVYRPA
jgi:dihydrofolate reductase